MAQAETIRSQVVNPIDFDRAGRQAGYSFAPAAGLFEPTNLAGDTAGWLHSVEDVDRDPIELRYRVSGVLWMCAGPGRVARGDVVGVVMTDYAEPAG